MTEPLMLIVPLLVLLAVAFFAFNGCVGEDPGPTSTPPVTPTPTPGPGIPTGPPSGPAPPVPPAPLPYASVVASTPGFSAYWRLNETSGNVAKDSGPLSSATDGRYVLLPTGVGVKLGNPGVTSSKDPMDKAPQLDGANGYVEVPYNAVLNPLRTLSFSVEFWVQLDPAPPPTQVLISSREIGPGKDRGFEIAVLSVVGQAPTYRARLFSSTDPPTEISVARTQGAAEEWQHIVVTYEGATKTMNLYVSVKGVASPFIASPVPGAKYEENLTGSLRFGAGHQEPPEAVDFLAGLIDEVAFYHSVLSATQVAAHFKAAS